MLSGERHILVVTANLYPFLLKILIAPFQGGQDETDTRAHFPVGNAGASQ